MARRLSRGVKQRVRKELGRRGPTPPGPTLGQLGAAFSPKFVLPEPLRGQAAARNIRATAAAGRRIAAQEGITFQEAAVRLRETAGEIQKRDVVLARARRRGISSAKALSALHLTDIDPKLLQVSRQQFVTPEGRFEVTGLPGERLKKRRLRSRPVPRLRPTPAATPRR